jgi:para-aminobenzoate synthetase
VHPADVFISLHAADENAFWLDREIHATERFSVIGGTTQVYQSDDFAELMRSQITTDADSADLPFEFRPGIVGYVAFEGEAKFLHVDRAMVFDHDKKMMHFIGEFDSQRDFDAWHHAALLRLALCGGEQAAYRMNHLALRASRSSVRHDDESYLKLIERAQAHIAAGDVYQLCLTNQITLEVSGDPLLAFLNLRDSNPAPFAAFLKFGQQTIISCSPEQFVKVDRFKKISSKPIKGTRRRDADPVIDAALADELRNDEKERAENLMIVDLMRNDFGRVAEPQSIRVDKLFDVESYASVHQLVSTVEAQLESALNAVDGFDAAFPGGSMTGAPKSRAVELIDELETRDGASGRGIYSGAIGYLTHGGVADFAMTIRTIVVDGDRATIGVGGGITIDSHPVKELEETKLKAAALLRVLASPDPWASA